MADYEIEFVRAGEGVSAHLALVSMLTGYDVAELKEHVDPKLCKAAGWWGRDYVATFRGLGFNCSPKFVPFDQDTPHPCLMRFSPTKRQMVADGDKRPWWAVVVYYRGWVYDPLYGVYALHKAEAAGLGLREWWNFDAYRVTSMMQVWLAEEPARVLV